MRFDKEKPISKTEAVLGASVVAAAATPALRNKWYKGQEVKLNKDSNRLLIVTEGGDHSFGGKGHETAAKALADAHELKHGKGSAKIMYQNDYMLGKPVSKLTKKLYNSTTSSDNSMIKRVASGLGFYGTYPVIRAPKRSKMTEEVRSFAPSRVITTHPDSSNFIKQTGIKPETVITDYGVKNKGNKAFWNTSRGWVFKDDNVSKAYAPSDDAMNLIDKTPHQRIGGIPIRQENFTPRQPLSKLTIWDNDGKETNNVKIDKTKKLVAISGGSTGADVESTLNEALKAKRNDTQFYVVTGNNKELRNKLLQRKDPNLIVQGYDKNWKGALDTADLAILRPHGLTPTEAAARKTPFIGTVTDYKKGKYSDSYAPHMVGNAEHYNRELNAPMAALRSDDSSKSLGQVLNETMDNIGSFKTKAQQNKTVLDSASEIINSPNATTQALKKISPLGKTLAYGGALTGTGILLKNRYKNERR